MPTSKSLEPAALQVLGASFRNAQFTNAISAAIKKGADTGVFTLPKGPAGKVKLAKQNKENESEKPKPATSMFTRI